MLKIALTDESGTKIEEGFRYAIEFLVPNPQSSDQLNR